VPGAKAPAKDRFGGGELKRTLLFAAALLCALIAAPQVDAQTKAYKTKNVIVAVMDGVRYSETFGDANRALIPKLAALEKEGALFTNFRIAGPGISVTRQGHSTLSTGTWQSVALGGSRMTMPTFFEYARNELGWKESDCYAIFGKGDYAYARFSSFPGYGEKYMPSFVMGIGEGKMENDDAVLARVCEAMDKDKPHLIFVNFGFTDHIAHVSTFDDHKKSIAHCDEMFGKLWEKVQSTPGYKDTTTVLFTNDHGRHDNKPDQPANGVQNHGDQCEGCRHIMLLAVGPDIKRGAVVDKEVQQIDLCPTVGELLGFQTPLSAGNVASECLVEPLGINKKQALTAEAREAVKIAEMSNRDMVKTIADANLKRTDIELDPSGSSMLLMLAMIRASAASSDARYKQFAQAWVDKNSGGENPFVARVALELGGNQEKLKAYAAKLAQETGSGDEQASMARISVLAKAWGVFQDQSFKDAAKAALGLTGKTEKQLITDWQKLNIPMTPMACDVPGKLVGSSTIADALKLALLADAAQSMPRERLVRLSCNLQSAICSQGRTEFGSNWPDEVHSAVTLASLIQINNLKPKIQWVAPPAQPKKGNQPQGPRWALPMQFYYKDSIPWQALQLRYLVASDGHFAVGDPASDGAALLLFATQQIAGPSKGKIQSFSN